jgi:hypothetical protein
MKPSEAVLSLIPALGLLLSPLTANAQQPTKVYRKLADMDGGATGLDEL